jgi:ABC-type glycerol-3-phosphate transport system substrate-binding protein
MKKVYKKLITIGMAVVMCISVAGCGGNQEVSTSGKSTKDYVYVPEYQEIADKGNIGNITISGNTIYYTSGTYDETAGTYSNIVKSMEVGSTESKELPIQLSENDSINSMMTDSNGNLIIVLSTYIQGETEEEYTQTYTFKKFDKDGNELFANDLTELLKEETSPYIQYAALDGQGNIYLSNSESKIWVFDGEGNQLFTIDSENYMQGFGTTKEGNVVFATYTADKMALQEVDFANKKLGNIYENIPTSYGNYTIMKGIDKGCLIHSGNSLFEYDTEAKTYEELLNWIDCDVNSDTINAVNVLEDGRILAIISDYAEEGSTTEMVYLTRKSASEVTEKTVITFGTLYMGSSIRREIIGFNKTNEKYRIHVNEYGSEDYTAGLAQLNSDIISGNSPDIIDLSNGSTQQYIEKGILEDLYPFMEKDTELKREDYLENVLKAYERDGKLYGLLPSFGISTLIGKTSDVGDKMGWTLNDLMTLVKSKPAGTEIFEYASKESILSTMCIYGMDQYVDWETGKCSFDSDSFIQLLEFSNTFSSESEYSYDENAPSMPTKIQNGQLLLTNLSINDVPSYQMYKAIFAEPLTFIGYPTDEGTGSAITTGEVLLAMSSKSKNKDGVWEFMRSFLTSEYQNSPDMWSFPIMKSALQAKFDLAMTPEYYVDETGKQVEQMKTSWGYDDFNVDIYAATQEDIDTIMNLINSVDKTYEWDTNMYTIISEESAAFFAGQKNAKEVADIIQSRIQIYVNENR